MVVRYIGHKRYISLTELIDGNKYKEQIVNKDNLKRFETNYVDPRAFTQYIVDLLPINKDRYKIESQLRTLRRLNIHINIQE